MLSLPSLSKVFVCRQPVDMRRSIDGLSNAVCDVVDQDPQSGHLFVFFNRSRDRVKMLWWDRSGYYLLYKRLEHGRFHLYDRADGSPSSFELSSTDLALLLEGIDLRKASRRLSHDEMNARKTA